MKKVLNSILASGLALALFPATAQAFSDTQGHWADSQIGEAYRYGIVSGTSATTYDPDRSLTGQEFASMMVSAVLKEELAQQTGGWPEQHIKALEATIIDSAMPKIPYEDGLTRFHAAQMIGGVLGSQGYGFSTIEMADRIKGFTDLFTNHYIKQSYLAGLTMEAGIMSGTSATTFEPERVLTRAEGAVIVLNMAKHSLFEGSLTTQPNTGTTTTPNTGTTTPNTGTTVPSISGFQQINLGSSTENTASTYYNGINRYGTVDYQNMFVVGNQYVLLDASDESIVLSVYDSSHTLLSSKTITNPLFLFGGATMDESGNLYVIYGQHNAEENNNKEVYRVVKYNSSFQQVAQHSILGSDCGTTEPFAFGSAALAENNGTLVVNTCRKGYTSSDGLNHQSQFSFTLDSSNLGNYTGTVNTHVSHSFHQLVAFDGDQILQVDHGDAAPRAVVLHYSNTHMLAYSDVHLMDIPGEYGANMTGLSLGGFAVGSNKYFTVVNRVNWDSVLSFSNFAMSGLGTQEREVILISTDKATLTSQHITLTSCIGKNRSSSTPHLVDLDNGTFMVLWEEYAYGQSWVADGLYYAIVNQNGTITTPRTLASDSATLNFYGTPVKYGNSVQWFTDYNEVRTLYQLPLH